MKHDKKYFIGAHKKSHKHQKYLDEKNDKKPNLQQTFLAGTYNAHVEVVVKAQDGLLGSTPHIIIQKIYQRLKTLLSLYPKMG